jgi:hypothetical protein
MGRDLRIDVDIAVGHKATISWVYHDYFLGNIVSTNGAPSCGAHKIVALAF